MAWEEIAMEKIKSILKGLRKKCLKMYRKMVGIKTLEEMMQEYRREK